MSFSADLKAALVTNLTAALGDDYTFATVYHEITNLDAEKWPFCMLHSVSKTAEPLDYQQESQVWSVTIHLVRRFGEESEMEDDIQACETQLATQRIFLSSLRSSWYAETAVDPTQDGRTVGIMVFNCTRVTD